MSRVTRHEMVAIRLLQLSETTARFCYRPIAQADAYPLFEVGRHPEFHRYTDWRQPVDVNGAIGQIQTLLAQELLNTSAACSIVDKPTGRWAGLLLWVPFRAGLALQLWLRPDLWPMDAGQELLDNALALVYRVTSVDNIYAQVASQDERFERLVEQHGMAKVVALETTNVFGIDRKRFLAEQEAASFLKRADVQGGQTEDKAARRNRNNGESFAKYGPYVRLDNIGAEA